MTSKFRERRLTWRCLSAERASSSRRADASCPTTERSRRRSLPYRSRCAEPIVNAASRRLTNRVLRRLPDSTAMNDSHQTRGNTMNAISTQTLRIACLAAALALFGCSQDATKVGSNTLAPGDPAALRTADAALDNRITLTFNKD